MSTLKGNQLQGFIDGASAKTTFGATGQNLGSTGAGNTLVACISIVTTNNVPVHVVSISDNASLKWKLAKKVTLSGINQSGITSGPVTQTLEIWYASTSTNFLPTSSYDFTITTNADNVDSLGYDISGCGPMDIDAPLDLNANSQSSGSYYNTGSTSVLSLGNITTDTNNVTVVSIFGGVGPGQRPQNGGETKFNGTAHADYGTTGDTFHLNQNYNVYGCGKYDVTSAFSGATVSSYNAVNAVVGLYVSFTQDPQVDKTAWNSADKDSGITLSDSDRQASTTGGDSGVRGLVSHDSGKKYLEFQNVVIGGLRDYFGFAKGSASLTSKTGDQFGIDNTGQVTNSLGGGSSNLGDPTGHTVGFAIDIDAGLFTFTYDGSTWYKGNPFGSAANPATGTNMVDYTSAIAAGTALYPWCQILKFIGATPRATLIVKGADFKFSIPSGYAAWTVPPPPGHQTDSYENRFGYGDRLGVRSSVKGTGVVTAINTNFEGEFGTLWAHMFDGDFSSGPVQTTTPTVDTSYVEVVFDQACIVTGVAVYDGDHNDFGTWKLYGSNDGVSYDYLTDIPWHIVSGGFDSGILSSGHTGYGFKHEFTNTTAYDRYKWIYHSGFGSAGRYGYDMFFRVTHSELDGGARTSDITVTTNMTENSGRAASKWVDGFTNYVDGASDLYYGSYTVGTSYLRFQFPRAVTMRDCSVQMESASNNSSWGRWKWQRSDDGITWTDEGSDFDFDTDSSHIIHRSHLLPDPGGSTPAVYWQMLCTDSTHTNNTYLYEMIFNLLEEPSGSTPVDGSASGDLVTVHADVFTPIPGQLLASVAASIVSTGEVHTTAIDGTPVYEFQVMETADLVYQTVDYHSLFSRGDRNNNLLIKASGEHGWANVFAPMVQGYDNGFGVGLGNGPDVQGTTPGNYVWWQFEEPVDIRGIKPVSAGQLNSSDQYTTFWSLAGAFGPGDINPFPYTAGFDGFNLVCNTLMTGTGFNLYSDPIEFDPRIYVAYDIYQMTLIEGVPDRLYAEVWYKVAHSGLDGGDRRPTSAPSSRAVTLTLSSDWTTTVSGGSFLQPQDAWFDGIYADTDANAKIANIGGLPDATHTQTTVGAWIQFDFPRPVSPHHLGFINYNNAKEEYDSGDQPMHYGVWHWEYAPGTAGPWTAVGDPWSFRENCEWMIAPRVGGWNLPTAPDARGAPSWRMVLDQGPAFGDRPVQQVMFTLKDVTGQAPPLTIAFTDDADGVPVTATVGVPASPYFVSLSDGTDDGFATANLINIPNAILTAAFTDEGQLESYSDLYPSVIVQTVVNIKGR